LGHSFGGFLLAAPSISDLIKEIKVGQLVLPEFQRGYVWTREQVKNYMRSLYRKYPTGHFLIWKTYAPQRSRGQSPASDNSFSRLILDGQQRLTSVFTLFEGKPPAFYEGETLYFNLYFNLTTEDFEFYQKSKMDHDPLWLAVTPFLMKGINEWLTELDKLPVDQRDLYLKFHLAKFNKLDAIRNYTYNLDEVTDKPIAEIVTIFNLVNSSGTELSNADLALARVCVGWPEARDTLKAAHQHFAAAGFNFKLEFLTRCISAVAVGNAYFEGGFDQAGPELVQKSWNDSERVLEYLVNILRNDAYIDSSDTLSSPYVLLPMVVYLSRQAGIFKDDAEKRGFLHWMYLALMWGRYAGSTDTQLQADVNALHSEDVVKALLANILQDRGRLKVEPQDLEGQGTRSRFYPITYIVARSKGAVDWFSGVRLYNNNLGRSFGLEDHHIFPQSVLYKSGYKKKESKDRKIVNDLANRAYLTKKANLRASNALPSKYLAQVQTKYPKALPNQFVPSSPMLWEVEHYPQFLTERRKLIAGAINSFLDALLEQDERQQPIDEQIKAIIAGGEGQGIEFKSSLRWDYKTNSKNKALESVIVKTVAGFMNGKGGTLLIGVGPKGEILGIENDYSTFHQDANRDGFEQKLTNLLAHQLGKELVPLVSVSFVAVESKDICWLRVEPSPKPVYVEDESNIKFYARLGNTTQPMNPKEMTQYISIRWEQGAAGGIPFSPLKDWIPGNGQKATPKTVAIDDDENADWLHKKEGKHEDDNEER